MNTKRRGGRTLFNRLTAEQREQLAEWLTLQNLTYEDARQLVEEQFNVSTSVDALRRFYSSFAVPWQYSHAAGEAEAFGELMAGNFDEATIRRAKQLAFSALTDRNPDVKTAKALLKIVGDTAKQELAQKRLELDLDKFRQLVKSDAEKGLDALQAELKGDPIALELFEKMRSRVMHALEAKA